MMREFGRPKINVRRWSLVVCLSMSVSCGGPELDFADWTIPVAEGTRIIEYPAVAIEERSEKIESIEDLVLGDDLSDQQQIFYQVSGVVPDADGNIFVNDRGNLRVQVFDPDGRYLRTIGQAGQGPGEFERPLYPAIGNGHLILRANTRRLSVWTPAGEHVHDLQLMKSLSQFAGHDAGFVARYSSPVDDEPRDGPPQQQYTYALFDIDGEEQYAYAEVLQPPPEAIDLGGTTFFSTGGFLPAWSMRFAVFSDGAFYLTTSDEYQLHSYGENPWALRVAWVRDSVGQEHRERTVASLADSFPDVRESALPFPQEFEAISNLEVDGHGHIYVFPFYEPLNAPRPQDTERPEVDRPADVFSPDGEHLFSGMISISDWTGALGDFVYGSRINRETDEYEVVRHRLAEPF